MNGTLKFIEGGLDPSGTGPLSGDGYFLALKWSAPAQGITSLKVGLVPSMGTGLVEAVSDPDHNGVFKITDPTSQKFFIIQSDGKNRRTQELSLDGLELEEVEEA